MLGFVSFEKRGENFTGFLSMGDVIDIGRNSEVVLHEATMTYERSIKNMQAILTEIQKARDTRERITARKIWRLGDTIFKLRDDLKKLSLQLDGLYTHLARDLNVKRMWLEKVVIFRRYLPKVKFIPKSLNWGQCYESPRRAALNLQQGLPPR